MSNPAAIDSLTDDAVVRQAKTNREAFGRLYDLHYPLIFRYCSRRLLARAAAEDTTSEVFLQIARQMANFPGETLTDFRCWAYRIAANAVNAVLRKQHRQQELLEEATVAGRFARTELSPEAAAADAADWAEVAQALAELEPREQTVVTLRYMQGLPYEEIGRVVEAKAATVRVILSRALERLRRRLNTNPAGAMSDGGNP